MKRTGPPIASGPLTRISRVTAVRRIGLTVLLVGAFLVPIGGTATASYARSCRSFLHTFYRTFDAQHWTFLDWIFSIKVQGAKCSAVDPRLTLDADNPTVRRGLGVYGPVDGWECRSFRPFSSGHGYEQWINQCKSAGGRRSSWLEATLHSHQTS